MIASAVRNAHHEHHGHHGHHEHHEHGHSVSSSKVIPNDAGSDANKSFKKKKRRLSLSSDPLVTTTVAREVYGERGSICQEQVKVVTKASFQTRYRLYGRLFWKIEPAALGGFEDTPLGIIHPQSTFMAYWGAIMMFFIVMCCLYVPYQVAFEYEESFYGTNTQIFWATLSAIMDVYFMIDLVINFRIGFIDDGELVTHKRDIAVRYFKSWFFIDFFSSVSTILQILASTDALAMLRNLRVLRLLRLLKLLRAVKINKVLESFDGISHELRAIVQMFKIFLYVVGVTHLLGCGFYAVAFMNPTKNWVLDYYSEKEDWGCEDIDCIRIAAGQYSMYLTGLYWAFVTVTTVGFGDICPSNDEERLYVLFCTFIGTAVFAFTVGEITAMASQSHVSDIAYAEQMAAMEEFLRRRDLPKEMRKLVRKSYETNWERCISFNDGEIIDRLPYSLRKNVQLFMKKSIIEKIPFFKHAGDELTYKLCSSLLPLTVNIGEDIVVAGEEGHEMYIIDKGEVEVLDEVTQAPLIRLGEGSFFGEIALLQEVSIRTKTVRACMLCELYSLNKLHFDEVLNAHPEFKDQCLKTARARLTRQASQAGLNLSPTSKQSEQQDVLQKFEHGLSKKLLIADEDGEESGSPGAAVVKWVVGDRVKILKEGSKQKGKTAVVTDPDWTGRVKVEVEGSDTVRSYLSNEIVKLAQHSFKNGDRVQVTKVGTHTGKMAVVTDPDWDEAGGRIKVKMDEDGSTKSYLSTEIKALAAATAEAGGAGSAGGQKTTRRDSVNAMIAGQRGSAFALPMSPAFFGDSPTSAGAAAKKTGQAAKGESDKAEPTEASNAAASAAGAPAAGASSDGGGDGNGSGSRRSSLAVTNSPMIYQRRALAKNRQSGGEISPRQQAFQAAMAKANLPPIRGASPVSNSNEAAEKQAAAGSSSRSASPSPTKKDRERDGESSSGRSMDKSMRSMKKDLQQLVESHNSLEKLVTSQVARQDSLAQQLELLLQVLAAKQTPRKGESQSPQ